MIKIFLALSASALLLSTGVFAEEVSAHHEVHWNYDEHGPAHWGEFAETCAQGKAQSPINIVTKKTVSMEPSHLISLDENLSTQGSEVNNGHALQINIANGGTVSAEGVTYKLVQFHIHGKSEEMINGKRYDLVAHMVHKSESGNLLVIAVLFNEGKTSHPMIQTVIDSVGKTIDINPALLLPQHTDHYYEFMGSLTTPPCSENVKWIVMKEVQSVTKKQLVALRKFYDHNYRPVQPLNGRVIESQ
jgi:carbonic anhydrase